MFPGRKRGAVPPLNRESAPHGAIGVPRNRRSGAYARNRRSGLYSFT
jgi:hypothetical protein